jgi:hypoxanthine phosphoribosyltransferase
MTEEAREWMTWADLGVAVEELAEQIDAESFRPDAVLALARGGLPVGGALAYALGVKNMATLNVEFYTGVDERLEEPSLLPPVPDLSLLRTERLLVVDDVADTGRTLALARDFCARHGPEVRTAVLYEKPQSVVRCDFVWRRTDRWINFPWSTPFGGPERDGFARVDRSFQTDGRAEPTPPGGGTASGAAAGAT